MLRTAALALTLWLATFTAQGALLGRAALTPGGTDYQAYYDDALNVTWTADANLPKTLGAGFGGVMVWSQAVAYVAAMNTQGGGAGYLGVNNWRLPTVTDTAAPGCDFAYAGTDCGFNVNLATGEMAHLYYNTLGNPSQYNASGDPNGCGGAPSFCLNNAGPFAHIEAVYWSGTEYGPDSQFAWLFGMASGRQANHLKNSDQWYVWAVHDGDALAVIPVPPAVWLFGSALGVMGWMRRLAR